MERLRPSPPVAVVRARLGRDGATVLVVNGSRVHDKASALDALAVGARFPDWFGRNLDAAADCLADLSWLEEKPVRLVWARADRLGLLPDADRAALLSVLAGAEVADGGPRTLSVHLLDALDWV